MMQQILFLMLGYPGAGKTTAAKALHKATGAEHLWADHERRLKYNRPTYSHQENIELYNYLNHVAEDMLKSGKSVIYDTNFSYYKDRQKLQELAAKYNTPTVVVWVTTDKELAKIRATSDAHKQETRVLGDMYESDFERISNKIEPPHPDETFITIDGTRVSEIYVLEQLAQNQNALRHGKV